MQYTDQEKIESYIDRSLTANETALLEYLIEQVSQFNSDDTHREWDSLDGEDPEAETRLFDGNGKKELGIDDFSSLEEVNILDSNGDTYVTIDDPDDYILYPLNATIKESVYLRSYIFPDGPGRVSIKAVFSSGEVPNAVVMVATALCGKYISRFSQTASAFKRESIEGYSYELLTGVDIDQETINLLATLDGLRRIDL